MSCKDGSGCNCDDDTKVYAEIGRNWAGIIELVRSEGFDKISFEFSNGDGSAITMTLEQLQKPSGVGLLRTAMRAVRGVKVMKEKESPNNQD